MKSLLILSVPVLKMAETRFRRVRVREGANEKSFSLTILLPRARTFRKKVPAFTPFFSGIPCHSRTEDRLAG